MKLSICIVNYNSGELLGACLDTIDRYPSSCHYEVIVVDNGSTDGSQATVADHAYTRLIQNQNNAGFARANNQAFTCSQGEYLFLLNPDTELTPGALDNLLACAEANLHAGLISAKLVNPDGTPQIGFNVRRLPGLTTAFAQLLLLDEMFPNNWFTRRYMCQDLDYERLQAVEQPAASALLYRRTTWVEVGGFDTRFTNWYNDVDLCKRVCDAGWEILFCPSAQIVHYGGMGSASRMVHSVIVESYRSQRLYFLNHFGRLGYGIVSGLVMCGMLLRLVALRILPRVESRVQTHARKDRPDAMRCAFGAVLKDTFDTWASLSDRFTSTDGV